MARPQQSAGASAIALRAGSKKKGHLSVDEFREKTGHGGVTEEGDLRRIGWKKNPA